MIDVKYINHMGTDLSVTNSARISFNRQSDDLTEKDEKLIKYLADHLHMSPFEHCILSVELYVPVYISKQIMRHRTFSYNEVSRRYTSEELEFYQPDQWRKQAKNNRQASEGGLDDDTIRLIDLLVDRHQQAALSLYNDLLAKGVCREQARGVLGQDLMTKFIMTGNLRNWVHFVKLRQHAGAQGEVQEVANGVKALLYKHFPVSTKALFGGVS